MFARFSVQVPKCLNGMEAQGTLLRLQKGVKVDRQRLT